MGFAMPRTYHHLSAEERAVLMIEHQNGTSLRAIARGLGRSPSTLSRELRRAAGPVYDATQAGVAYRQRRTRSRKRHRLVQGTPLFLYVHDHLVHRCWSPQQIAAKLRAMPEADRPGMGVHPRFYGHLREGRSRP